VLAAALYFTRSRGGLLAGGAAVLTFVAYRHGRNAAIACGLVGALALPLIAGRQGDIDLEEGGTGHERIVIWKDGLEGIKNANVVFGIGLGRFDEHIGIAAHISYLQMFVELGLFGGTLFLGCFAFTALALCRLRKHRLSAPDAELTRFSSYLAALIAGWCTGLLTLSRCYVVPTYLIVGLGAVYTTLMNGQLRPPRFLVVWDRTHVQHLLAGSASLLVLLTLIVKLFGS
jgi:O-antigen ligase